MVTGTVDATGCDIGVYFNGEGRVDNADIYGALWYGVMVHGDATNASVDITDSSIHDIGDNPLNGNQRGIGIYYRAFFSAGTATGRISGNTIAQYQKGGIVANGPGTDVQVQDNTVTGPRRVRISDVGNNDKMTGNRVSGAGYDPEMNPGAYTVFIDADVSFTNRPKVHGNK